MRLGTTILSSSRRLAPALAVASVLALAGCAVNRPYRQANTPRYGTVYSNPAAPAVCNQCGVVRSVREVYIDGRDGPHPLGTIIGAVAGGLLGNTVGKGDGRKAATVAGAVIGGAVGNRAAARRSDIAYEVVVALNDGRYATVTQPNDPGVQRGDRVRVRNNQVYLLR